MGLHLLRERRDICKWLIIDSLSVVLVPHPQKVDMFATIFYAAGEGMMICMAQPTPFGSGFAGLG